MNLYVKRIPDIKKNPNYIRVMIAVELVFNIIFEGFNQP